MRLGAHDAPHRAVLGGGDARPPPRCSASPRGARWQPPPLDPPGASRTRRIPTGVLGFGSFLVRVFEGGGLPAVVLDGAGERTLMSPRGG
jgi:hypothetical protein